MISTTRFSVRRRTIAGATAILAVVGLGAFMTPVAFGSGGDNVGPAVTGPAASPDIAKKDRSAVIDANGAIARGKGVVSVTHSAGAGSYIVFFNKDVSACTFTATIGLSGSSGTSARGFITTVGAAAGATGVFVTTDDIAGNPSERGFHLYVGC
jgi:hypothetical protein